MAELVHDAPHDASDCLVCRFREQGPRRLTQAAALFAAGLAVTTGVLALRPATAAKPRAARAVAAPRPAPTPAPPAPVRAPAVSARAADAAAASFDVDAQYGVDRGLLLASPGGVFATAARVARWRPLVVRAAHAHGLDPNLLEALVFVESSGRAAVSNGTAVGLVQLHPAAARSLGLRVASGRSAVLTRRIARTGNPVRAGQLGRWRARYDERYAPARALNAAAASIAAAEKTLGRTDLAVEAYHVGLRALRAYRAPYAELYVRSGRMDDFWFQVLAAERVMRLWRHDQGALSFEVQQQLRKNSSEEYMHPFETTPQFAMPSQILHAEVRHVLRMIPVDTRSTHIAISGTLGAEAHKLGRARRLYRALRPQALAVLLYIGSQVHDRSHARRPLVLTSAVRDDRYQRVLMNVNVNAARTYSTHTTGFTFDIARTYGSAREGRAFQFVLDRLAAVDAIAYIRESAAMHIAVATDAPAKLKLLETLGS